VAANEGVPTWLVVAVGGGSGIMLLVVIVLVVVLLMRRQRPTHAPADSSSAPEREVGAQTTSVPCDTCDKKLKVRASLAGKKVKCPHCGSVNLIPHSPHITQIKNS
jgi:phage FluMu protein Com